MSYRQVLDEAIGDSPVSGVDVERVIRRERRARSRRWGAGATAAAVLTVVAAVTVLTPGSVPKTGDPAGPTITTTPGTPEDKARIDRAVVAAVAREAPAVTWVRPFGVPDPDRPLPPSSFDEEAGTRVGYDQTGDITVGGVGARLAVEVHRDGARSFGDRSCEEGPNPTTVICEKGAGPNGERLRTVGFEHREKGRGGKLYAQNDRTVLVLRPDGAMVGVWLQNMRQDGRFPLSVDQQTAVALDPAVALAPLPPGVVLPSAEPRPTPTKSAEQIRIDNAVFAALRRQAPTVKGAGGADDIPTDLASVWGDSGGENTADSYWGQGRIIVGAETGRFDVQIWRKDPGLSGDLTCGKQTKTYRCTAGVGPNGERYRTVTNTRREGSGVAGERTVTVRRKDGSVLAVTLAGDPPDGKFPLTAAQQQAIALDPAVALAGN
ncbi:hypothetical protein ACGFIE_03630 [Micromonospora sp. NPDC049275]|uniref:hypothetical protein n=1 Tax=Micromonospora sp. NPDC049275 TaxID=3364268 RepID=UPI003712B30C